LEEGKDGMKEGAGRGDGEKDREGKGNERRYTGECELLQLNVKKGGQGSEAKRGTGKAGKV
jgi:hypothetical protein